MLSAPATSTRSLIGALLASGALALYSGCGDQSSERNGGGDIPDLNAGSQVKPDSGVYAGAAGEGEGGAAGASVGSGVPWCDAYAVINCVCQQCHQTPAKKGAPFPLLSYDDTQAKYPALSKTNHVWQSMLTAIDTNFMPLMGSDIMPPVKPLTEEQRTTLLTWLSQGALDEGGQACTATCDWSDGTPDL